MRNVSMAAVAVTGNIVTGPIPNLLDIDQYLPPDQETLKKTATSVFSDVSRRLFPQLSGGQPC